jgi:hypothetical protein
VILIVIHTIVNRKRRSSKYNDVIIYRYDSFGIKQPMSHVVNNQSPIVRLESQPDHSPIVRLESQVDHSPVVRLDMDDEDRRDHEYLPPVMDDNLLMQVKNMNLEKRVVSKYVEIETKIIYTFDDGSTKEVIEKNNHTFHN